MFNEKVLAVLGQINGITNSAILKYPVTVTESEERDMQVRWDISKLDSTEFPELPLFNSLDKFLNTVKLFKAPEFNFVDNIVQIKGGDADAEFILSNRALMETYDRDDTQFKKTEEVPTVSEFDLTVKDISSLKSAGNVFKDLEDIIVESKDGSLILSLGNTSKFNANSNKYNIKKSVESTKEYSIAIPLKNFNRLPPSEYTVQVKYNATRDAYRVLLKCKSIDGLDIMLAIKAK